MACGLILLAVSANGDGLRSEIDRLHELASDPALGDNASRVRDAVEDADTAVTAGRTHLAAEHLGGALVIGEALAYRAGKKDEIEDFEAFAAEWRTQATVADRARELVTGEFCGQAPAQVRALVEASLNQVPAYYHAAGAMGPATNVETGLYYLGRAVGALKIVNWCELMAAEPRTAPVLRSLGRELAELETATGREYARPGAAIDKHSDFIGLNATIKELRELDGKGLRFGALYKYLDGVLRVTLLADPEADGDRAALLGQARDLDARLDAAPADHGIARIFLDRATAALTDTEAEATDLAAAEHVLGRVLPAYFEIVGVPEP